MRPRLLALVMVVLVASVAGCSGDESIGDAPDAGGGGSAAAAPETDVVYGTWRERELTLDVYAPTETGGAPLVVYLPGQFPDSTPIRLVEQLVEQGAIVVSVKYAARTSGPMTILSDHGVEARAMADSVACAMHLARARAAELGSADPVVAVAGFSLGGGLAAHVALSGATLEAGWEGLVGEGGPAREVECVVTEGSTHVDALIGLSGAYDLFVPFYEGLYGLSYQQDLDPVLWQFLADSVVANPDLTVRLLHGEPDGMIPFDNSVGFEEALAEAGFDVELIPFDGGHSVPQELAADTIMDTIGR